MSETHLAPPLLSGCIPASLPNSANLLAVEGAGLDRGPLIEISKPGPNHFDIVRFVGSGGFGNVYLTRDRFENKYFAMKVVPKDAVRKKNNILYMKSEKNIMIKVGFHPFVVFLHYTFQTKKNLYLVMDYLAGGELFFHLRKKGIVVESVARIYFAEMVLAIDHMHSLNVIHRDLKPENVMLNSMGHVAITDFGLAKDLSLGNNPNMMTKTVCGTLEYMPPEMLLKVGYGKNVDFWLLGILLYELLVGFSPFSNGNYKDNLGSNTSAKEIERRIMQDKLSLPSFLGPDTHSILKGLLEKDASKRLGFSKSTMFVLGGMAGLKAHKFFNSLDFHALLSGKVQAPYDMQELHSLIRGLESGTVSSDSSGGSEVPCSKGQTIPAGKTSSSNAAGDTGLSSTNAVPPISSSVITVDVDNTSAELGSSEVTNFSNEKSIPANLLQALPLVRVDSKSGSSLSSNLTVNTALTANTSGNDRVENMITANFANAYTSRPISVSFLEDQLCNGCRAQDLLDDTTQSTATAVALASTGSGGGSSGSDAIDLDQKDFEDFDYSSGSWFTAEDRLLEIKADIKKKLAKLMKRKKMEEIRTEKEAGNAKKLKQEKDRLDSERQRKAELTRLNNRNIEIDKLSKSILLEIVALDAAIEKMQQEEKVRLESADKMSKRLKKLNKILREIEEIEEIKKDRSKKLNADQKDKLSKKIDVEKEKDEVEGWLEANCKDESSESDSNASSSLEYTIRLTEMKAKADLLQGRHDLVQKERSENITTIGQITELLSTISGRTNLCSNNSGNSNDNSFISFSKSNIIGSSSIISEDNCSYYTPTNNASPQGIYKPPTPSPKVAIPSPYSTWASSSSIPSPTSNNSNATNTINKNVGSSGSSGGGSASNQSQQKAELPSGSALKVGGGGGSSTSATTTATATTSTASSSLSADDAWEVPKNVKKTGKR